MNTTCNLERVSHVPRKLFFSVPNQISTKREARASKIVAMISDYLIKRLSNLIWELVVTPSFVLQVKLTGHYNSLTSLTKSQAGNPL